ncbi:MAG TPA: polysaccharide deacetylase family protein [Polyangiaceae bacterium]
MFRPLKNASYLFAVALGCGLTCSCGADATDDSASAGASGTSGSAGASGANASGAAGTAGASAGSGGSAGASGSGGTASVYTLPVPPGAGVAKPAGTPGNLSVLNWAGFKAAVSFSFDDALSSQIDHYAELQATGVHLTFYLVSSNNATSATWTQAAKDGHELGNHTAHHCHDDGTGCSWGSYDGSLGAELDECTTHITQTFGQSDVWTAASPYGDLGYATPDATRFLLNRGVNGGLIAANDGTSPYALPCHVAAMGETQTTPGGGFNGATDAARTAGEWQIFLVHSLGGDGGYNPVSVTDVVGALDYTQTLGDVWADSVVHVGAYWRAQKLFTGLTPTSDGTNQTWTWTLPDHFPPGQSLRVTVDGGTLSQGGSPLAWSDHGYYEVALDAGSLTLGP